MALTSRIVSYDPDWPARFIAEKEHLDRGFAGLVVAIHHVGSTAVPGLAAKPELDILIEVACHENVTACDDFMRGLGYVRGGDLSEGHHFYRRNVRGVRTHKVHVCISGHEEIDRMLRFRDLLRADARLRTRYQELKLRLEAENRDGMGEYLARKAPFIRAALAGCGAAEDEPAGS